MIEDERACLEIAQQLHAIEKAVCQAKRTLIQDHIDHCLEDTVHIYKPRGHMKQRKLLTLCFSVLLLASCGKKDVQSACYSNGDHANMSDGRITRICMCVSKRVAAQGYSEKETNWIIAMIEKDSLKIEEGDKERWREVSKIFSGIKQGCEAEK
jgi:Metal-sensitive transcriptional repressor